MSKVIRNGTIVTADRTWKADVLVEGETIKAIGENLKGDQEIDATDAYVIPGGIDPHTHLEMPFMGTTAAETFESGTFAARVGRDDDAGRLRAAGGGREPARARSTSGTASRSRRSASISATIWRSPAGTSRIWREMDAVVKRGVNTFKHFMAYKGALMVEDDEMYRVVQAVRRARGAAARPCGERRHRRGAAEEVHGRRADRAGGARLFAAAARSRARRRTGRS